MASPAAGDARVAYFSMEIGLWPAVPTYAGGLGVLAGDTVRGAADLGLPMVAVTLVHREGYFRQHLSPRGDQTEEPARWRPEDRLERVPEEAEVEVSGRRVRVGAWRAVVEGAGGSVPVLFLDTSSEANHPDDRSLTDRLYGGGLEHRLAQELVLGIGGVAALRATGHRGLRTFHMNEGHSALLTIALLEEAMAERGLARPDAEAWSSVRGACVFTTHTPVPAGHDQFPGELARRVLGEERMRRLESAGCCLEGVLNMTYLGLRGAHFVNGVAARHREVSTEMFPGYPIDAITNGVHAATWTSEPFQELFDRRVPEWRRQNANLRYVLGVPVHEIRAAHAVAKRELLRVVEDRAGRRLRADACTLGFARRATGYKRASLVFSDLAKLRRISRERGPLQMVFSGKAHPMDEGGKEEIRRVHAAAAELGDDLPVVWLEDYDMALGEVLCAGADVWLNTPLPPMEASGTSGMKAALNGVPSLSTLDGWWVEGCLEGVTGWSIASDGDGPAAEAESLYDRLAFDVLPLYGEPERFGGVMRAAIAVNGSFFNAERMVFQYAENAYGL